MPRNAETRRRGQFTGGPRLGQKGMTVRRGCGRLDPVERFLPDRPHPRHRNRFRPMPETGRPALWQRAATQIVQRRSCGGSEARGLGQIHAKTVAAALVAPGHFGGGVTEVFLDMRLIDLGRGGQARAQRMAREKREAFGRGQVRTQTAFQHGGLDQARDMLVRKAVSKRLRPIPRSAHENGSEIDLGKVQPLLQRMNRAGRRARRGRRRGPTRGTARVRTSSASRTRSRRRPGRRPRPSCCRRPCACPSSRTGAGWGPSRTPGAGRGRPPPSRDA